MSAALICLALTLQATDVETPPLDAEAEALSRDFERFEDNLLKAAEHARRSDPTRGELLGRARGLSSERRIREEMGRIVAMLRKESPQYGAAGEAQERVVDDLRSLIKLLQSESQRQDLEERRKELEAVLKATEKLIAEQRDLRSDTARGQDEERLAKRQDGLSDDASEIAERLEKANAGESADGESEDGEQPDSGERDPEENAEEGEQSEESKPSGEPRDQQRSGDSPPGEPMEGDQSEAADEASRGADQAEQSRQSGQPQDGQKGESQQGQQQKGQQDQSPQQDGQQPKSEGEQSLEQARERMQQAIDELEKKKREAAGETQDQIVRDLERLKAELEEILRQLREEEEVIMLAMIEARLQQMLQAQLKVNDATTKLDRTPAEKRGGAFAAEATQLARSESDILTEADRALRVLREEGSSLVFPEAMTQVRDSMRQVARRLGEAETGSTTQLVERLVVEQLEQMIEALQDELDRKEQQQQDQQQQPSPQQEQEKALIDQIAELKLIRALQDQVNRMTTEFDAAVAEAETADGALSETDQAFLDDLTARQERIRRITYDIATGRGK